MEPTTTVVSCAGFPGSGIQGDTIDARLRHHRPAPGALYRSIVQDYPADNVRLEVAQFTCANDIQRLLAPYLTGKGLPGRAHRVVALPTQAHIQRVLANMM